VFRTTRPLPVAHGLTVAAGFPKAVVLQPTRCSSSTRCCRTIPRAHRGDRRWRGHSLFYLLAWALFGRDRPAAPSFRCSRRRPACRPRRCASSKDMTFDDRVFTAAIVGLGVNGRLKLVDHRTEQELHHLKGTSPIDAAGAGLSRSQLFAKAVHGRAHKYRITRPSAGLERRCIRR
jgi:hypothetical protein